MQIQEIQRQITRVTIDADVQFENFADSFRKRLGHFDQQAVIALKDQPSLAEAALKEMEGDQRLMIFFTLDHGTALRIVGKRAKALRFILGNPLVAIQMTKHDIRAGQHVPLTVIVYEHQENQVRIEYDLPSSILGVCENEEVDKIARDLDNKLLRVIEHAIADATEAHVTKDRA